MNHRGHSRNLSGESSADGLARQLAREARERGLNASRNTDPQELLAFAQLVLEELAARGLLEGPAEIGCWAAPRSGAN